MPYNFPIITELVECSFEGAKQHLGSLTGDDQDSPALHSQHRTHQSASKGHFLQAFSMLRPSQLRLHDRTISKSTMALPTLSPPRLPTQSRLHSLRHTH